MRSRYTAYALGRADHVERTWHPRTRPAGVTVDPAVRWTGLDVSSSDGGGPDDDEGTVTFTARWESGDRATRQSGVLEECSRFERRAGRWFYVGVAADHPEGPPRPAREVTRPPA